MYDGGDSMRYGYGYGGGLFFNSSYILIIAAALICLGAQALLKSVYAKYSKVKSCSGLTGEQTALRVLRSAGITDVQVVPVSGKLTDHYDPRTKKVCLSEGVYKSTSLAAVGVAAHECGHAIQHAVNYVPLSVRSAIVPAANFGSTLSWPLFLLGLLLSLRPLAMAGILLFSLAVLFQLVTLPVEFNASRRALAMLESTGVLSVQENKGARKVLGAAALTYVAALASSVLQLLRMVMIANGGRRRDN